MSAPACLGASIWSAARPISLRISFDNELAAAAGGYLSYAGPFTVVNDGLIAHHVEVSLLPNWIGGIQYRKAHLRDSWLELSSAEPMLMAGQPRIAKLVWARA